MAKGQHYTARQLVMDRKFWTIIYPDSTTYDCSLLLNRGCYWREFYYAYHDRDTYNEEEVFDYNATHDEECPFTVGQLKKPHYHVIGVASNPISLGQATIRFGLHLSQDEYDESNHVQVIKNVSSAVQYLVHMNNPEKFQYERSTIIASANLNVDRFFKGVDRNEQLKLIFNFINANNCTTTRQVEAYCATMGLLSTMMSAQLWIRLKLDENKYIRSKEISLLKRDKPVVYEDLSEETIEEFQMCLFDERSKT